MKTPLVTTSQGRSDTTVSISFYLRKPWKAMTAMEQCDALGIIAADLGRIAAEAQEERLEIAERELSA